MKTKSKMQWKITLPIMAVLLAFNLLAFLVVRQSSKQSLTKQIEEEVTAITHSVVEAVLAKNQSELGSLEKMSRSPIIENSDVSLYEKQQFVSYIHERCRDPYYSMVIVDSEGKGYNYGETEITDFSSAIYVQEALKGNFYVSSPFTDELSGGGYVQAYSVPVYDVNDNVVGAIFSTLSGSSLSTIASSFVPSENTTTIIVNQDTGTIIGRNKVASEELDDVDENGKPIVKPMNFYTLMHEEGVKEAPFYVEAITALLNGETKTSTGKILGNEIIMACEPVPGTNWSVLVPAPYTDFSGEVRNLENSVFVTLLLSMIIIGIIGVIVVRLAVRPLKGITSAVDDLSSGNADLTKRIQVKTNDEVGSVVTGINNFTEKLQGIIQQLKKAKDELGLAGTELDAISEDTTNSVSQILGNIKDVNSQILNQSDSVTETAGAVNQIASNIESLEKMIETQTTGVSEASAAVEEMIGNIGSVNVNVEKMASSFLELENRAVNGVAKQVDVNDKIHQIENQSETLQEANSAIAAIAEQTNLLAMNAAIEAAHAGEAGKGFSVVADEIRKLSETSSEQSKTIGEQLNKIQELIGDVVAASGESSDAFQIVANEIKETDELVRQIKSAMAEQQEGSKQIGTALHDMNDSTSEVRLASKEMSEGNQSILEEVRQLQDATGVMKSSVQNMQDSARKVSDTEAALRDIVNKMQDSIRNINSEIDQFKV